MVALLVCSGLIAWTWKRLVQGLYIGLTGREWLIKGNVFLTLSLLCAAGPVIYWIGDRAVLRALWDSIRLDPRRPGLPEDVRRRVDRHAPV